MRGMRKSFCLKSLVRLDRKAPSPTIVTDGRRYYHPIEDRYLTVREAASLQSFPSNFVFSGALTKMWVQIGNAVPPLMAKSIGESIFAMHSNRKKKIEVNTDRDLDLMRSIAFKYSEDTSCDNPKLSQMRLDFQKTITDKTNSITSQEVSKSTKKVTKRRAKNLKR